MISVDVNDMPAFFHKEEYIGNSMKCKKLQMLPIECIVRGYITGSGWESYKKCGEVCGIKLPEGLIESDKLPEPIYTPSTKAEIGDHDENISFESAVLKNTKAAAMTMIIVAIVINPDFFFLLFILYPLIDCRDNKCPFLPGQR